MESPELAATPRPLVKKVSTKEFTCPTAIAARRGMNIAAMAFRGFPSILSRSSSDCAKLLLGYKHAWQIYNPYNLYAPRLWTDR